MTVKMIVLRRDGSCVVCSAPLPAGSTAQWDSGHKTITCVACMEQPAEQRQLVGGEQMASAMDIEPGAAGASAQREYERRRDKREKDVRTRHPRIGGVILALSDEPQSTTAWAKGAVGERKVAEALEGLRSDEVVVLHDRRVPGKSSNIDHVVVASSGVHVIDAKRYKGKVEIRSSGSIFRPGPNLLYVGGRNQTKAVEKMHGQVEVVRAALDRVVPPGDLETVVRPSLCFIDAEWGWFAKPEMLQGVRISGPNAMIRFVSEPGSLMPEEIVDIGTALAARLKPA